jgi:segregation and condensation protein B
VTAPDTDTEADTGVPETESAGTDVPAPDPAAVDESELTGALEAILLIVDTPVTEDALAAAVGFPPDRVREELHTLANRLAETRSGIHLRQVGGGWRFYTRDRFAPVVERFVLDGQQARLSRAALETLAVIAYRQPVTRARVSAVRGVNVDGVLRTLSARGLIEEVGSDADTGGLLYRTTELFLERMGLGSLDELPPLGPLLPDVDALDVLED